jgi:osmotically inducible protein OsmC
MATRRTAEVQWIGGLLDGEGTITKTTTGALPELGVSWNSRVGIDEQLTSPEELLAAAHAACFAMQFTYGLVGAGGDPQQMNVTAEVTFEPGLGITSSVLTARPEVFGLTDDKIREIAERAKLGCPISRALAGVNIRLDLPTLAPPPSDEPEAVAGEPAEETSEETSAVDA